jgi:hypothetical protein
MRKLLFAALCGLAATVGCRQCASPYDYCSPVVENGPQCGPGPMQGGGYEDDYAANRGGRTQQNAGPQNSGPQSQTVYDGPQMAGAVQDDGPQGSQAYSRQ